MHRRRLMIALAVTALLGCEQTLRAPAWSPDGWSYKRRPDEPRTLAVSIPVAIDVESFNGNVKVRTDPELTVATVRVIRQARHGFKRRKEAKASLDQIGYSVEVVPGDLGQVLQVRTWTTHGEPHFQQAHVLIEVPAGDGLRVRTHRGKVESTNVEGVINIVNDEGDIRVLSDLPLRRPVTIISRTGDIDYRVRGESTGSLSCESVRGRVDHRILYGTLTIENGTDQNTLLATLNSGFNPVVLRTVEGNIRVAVVHNPTQVGAHIFEP